MSLKSWVFLFCVTLGASIAGPTLAQESVLKKTIVVIGEARISATPDKAVITLGARHSAKSAADALAQTSQTVTAILSRMAEMGVDKSDMQTSSLNMNPIWRQGKRYNDEGETLSPIGFEASNTVNVTLRDLDSLGDVLDQVTRDGANSFSGFKFGLLDPAPVQDQARSAAIVEARRKAQLYATAAGLNVGEVLLITEQISAGSRVGMDAPAMLGMSARSSSVPIAQGEITQSARVKVIFAIAE